MHKIILMFAILATLSMSSLAHAQEVGSAAVPRVDNVANDLPHQ